MTQVKHFLSKIWQKNANFNQKQSKIWLKFTIHPVTVAFFILSIFFGAFWIIVSYFVSLLLHELAHALVASKLGYKCDKITFYPTGALLSGAYDEFRFKDEILVSIAGPLVNLILIVVCLCLWWIFPELYNYLQVFVVANLSLLLFNLLPIFPLDGGRVLLAFFSSKFDRKIAVNVAHNISIVFSILLFIYFIVTLFNHPNFQIGLMSIVVFISTFADNKELCYKRVVKSDIKKKKILRGLKVSFVMVDSSLTVSKVYTKIDNFAYYKFLIVDKNLKILAEFDELQIEEILTKYPIDYTFDKILNNV